MERLLHGKSLNLFLKFLKEKRSDFLHKCSGQMAQQLPTNFPKPEPNWKPVLEVAVGGSKVIDGFKGFREKGSGDLSREEPGERLSDEQVSSCRKEGERYLILIITAFQLFEDNEKDSASPYLSAKAHDH
jgi:hypothetical protein